MILEDSIFQWTLLIKYCLNFAMLQYHILHFLHKINVNHLYLFSNLNQLQV